MEQTPKDPKTAERRRIAAFVLAGIVIVLCAVNLQKVEVDFVIASWHAPLLVVIAVSALLGAGADRLVQRRSRSAARASDDHR